MGVGVGAEGGEEDQWRRAFQEEGVAGARPGGSSVPGVSEEQQGRVFPSGSAAKNQCFLCMGWGFDPWSGH